MMPKAYYPIRCALFFLYFKCQLANGLSFVCFNFFFLIFLENFSLQVVETANEN